MKDFQTRMLEDSEPFLPVTEGSRRKTSRLFTINILIHFLIICLYTVISLAYINYKIKSCLLPVNAIDGLNIKMNHSHYDLYESTGFVGSPGPETDALWERVLHDKHIRVSKDELLRNGRTSVELPGGGYLAWIGVFHELHCTNLLRQWKHKDHYFGNTSHEEMEKIEKHTDHCLDRIRATLMCHPDLSSLTTFFWDEEPRPKVNGTKTLHDCVDWNTMMASTEHRTVHHEEIALLQNPNSL